MVYVKRHLDTNKMCIEVYNDGILVYSNCAPSPSIEGVFQIGPPLTPSSNYLVKEPSPGLLVPNTSANSSDLQNLYLVRSLPDYSLIYIGIFVPLTLTRACGIRHTNVVVAKG